MERKFFEDNELIHAVINSDFDKVKKLVEKYFVKKFEEIDVQKPTYPVVVDTNCEERFVFKHKDNQQAVVYILGDNGEQNFHKRVVYNLFYAVLGFGMSSKLFEIIRGQMGLVYSIDAGCSRYGKNLISEIMFATSNEKVSQTLLEVKKILKSCHDGEISEQELERAKNKFVANIAFSNERNSSIAQSNGSSLLKKGKIRSDREILNEYQKVTLDEIKECAKQAYLNKKYVVSCVGQCKKSDLYAFKN